MLKKTLSTAFAVFLLWCMFSYIDIVSDNNSGSPKHSDYNIVILLNERTKGGAR